MVNLGDNGMWDMHAFGTNIPQDEAKLKLLIDNFKSLLDTSLFNILKAQQGEFWIAVQYSSIGDIIIDLQFNDFAQINGMYVTSANLGGLNQSVMGNQDSFIHNSTWLNVLTNAIGGGAVEDTLLETDGSLFEPTSHSSSHNHPNFKTINVQNAAPILRQTEPVVMMSNVNVGQTPVTHLPTKPVSNNVSKPVLGGGRLVSPLLQQ